MFSRKKFAERLKSLLSETNTTHNALAEALGISRVQITSYCSQSRQPTVDNLVAIAEYFDVSVDYLLGRE